MTVITFYLCTRKKTNWAANDGYWHHICLVWTSEGGKVAVLNNDLSILSGTKFSEGETIPGMQTAVMLYMGLFK